MAAGESAKVAGTRRLYSSFSTRQLALETPFRTVWRVEVESHGRLNMEELLRLLPGGGTETSLALLYVASGCWELPASYSCGYMVRAAARLLGGPATYRHVLRRLVHLPFEQRARGVCEGGGTVIRHE